MDKQAIEKRLAEIDAALEQSAANHNALLGRKTEARSWLEEIFKKECEDARKGEADAANEG